MRFLHRRDRLDCRAAVELMTDYLDGVLPPAPRARLEAHLAACPHCAEYLAQLRTTVQLAARTSAGRPDAATEHDLAQLYRSWRRSNR